LVALRADDELATILSQTRPKLIMSGEKPTIVVKTVKVHEDTHRALKRLKAKRRRRSIDEVIREMIRTTTGTPVGAGTEEGEPALLSYVKG
jgi:ribbon-helix-helix CopG family protein